MPLFANPSAIFRISSLLRISPFSAETSDANKMGSSDAYVPLAKAVSRGTAGGWAVGGATGAGANQRGDEWGASGHEVLRGRDRGGDRKSPYPHRRSSGHRQPAADPGARGPMISLPSGAHIWIAAGVATCGEGSLD